MGQGAISRPTAPAGADELPVEAVVGQLRSLSLTCAHSSPAQTSPWLRPRRVVDAGRGGVGHQGLCRPDLASVAPLPELHGAGGHQTWSTSGPVSGRNGPVCSSPVDCTPGSGADRTSAWPLPPVCCGPIELAVRCGTGKDILRRNCERNSRELGPLRHRGRQSGSFRSF
jgi:hypothetical protein